MKVRAISSGLLSRFLQRTPSQVRSKVEPEQIWDVVEVPIPHPELDLDDFWAFRRATE